MALHRFVEHLEVAENPGSWATNPLGCITLRFTEVGYGREISSVEI